jgi:hypothetical protein
MVVKEELYMDSLNLPDLKGTSEQDPKPSTRSPSLQTRKPASPPPLSTSMVPHSAGTTLTLPPPPPPGPVPQIPTPTPTSLHTGGNARISDGWGIAGGVLLKLVMVLAANGIGFGVWWYTQGRYSDEAEMSSEAVKEGEPWAASSVDAEEARAAEAKLEELRIQAMFDAADFEEWPMVMLSGMVAGSTPNKTSAILNGILIAQHQTIDGIELVEVKSDGVVLEYKHTRKYLRIGEST